MTIPTHPGTATAQQSMGCTLAEYADAENLPFEFLKDLGVSDCLYGGSPAIRIPHFSVDRSTAAVLYRIALYGEDRFRWKTGDSPVLYGLDRFDASSPFVVIVEGPSDAQTLWFAGLPALGLPGAAGWSEERDALLLDGVETIYVVIEPDSGGVAVERAISQSRIRDRVRFVRLGEFKDVSELYLGDPDRFKERFQQALDAATPCVSSETVTATKAGAASLIEIGLGAELFHDERRDAYSVVEVGGVRRILRVCSKDFRQFLAHVYYEETGKAPKREALLTAISICEAQAIFEGDLHPLHVRFARPEPAEIWVDLCDEMRRAVRVTPDGWQVVERPPILFRRFNHQWPLPLPVKGGQLAGVLDFLNVQNPADRILLLAWLVVAPIADIARAPLGLHGPQGSAKTTAARILKGLVDPSAVENLSVGRDVGEIVLHLDHHAVPFFDNLSELRSWVTDLLCRAVTGGGFSKRQLFTDADDVIFIFKRVMLLTGINVPTAAPDLLDRFLLIKLDRVPPARRREEAELLAEFEKERPAILGGLLDALAATLRIYPSLRISDLPRMADFARWGAAAAEALGYGHAAFLEAYRANTAGVTEEVLESDPVGVAVRQFAREHSEWTGAVSGFLEALGRQVGESVQKQREWPKDASRLSKRLRVLQTSLAEAGVQVIFPEKKTAAGYRAVEVRFLAPALPVPPDSNGDGDLSTRNWAGGDAASTPDLPPAGLAREDGPSGGAGGTGGRSPDSAVCGYHVGELHDPCRRCGRTWREHAGKY
jgi:hypothetical protein